MLDNKPRWRVVGRPPRLRGSSSRWSREPGSRRTSVTVLIQRLLVALAAAAALGGCATALVTKDDALSKEAPASPPAYGDVASATCAARVSRSTRRLRTRFGSTPLTASRG